MNIYMNFSGVYDERLLSDGDLLQVPASFKGSTGSLSQEPEGTAYEIPVGENSDVMLLTFENLEGTDGYCTEEARSSISHAIREVPLHAVHLLDNGNYHYLTELYLERIHEPFDLAVFDHHTDMQPSALLPLLSCGNWILEALERCPLLKRVLLLGPPKEAVCEIPEEVREKVIWISEEELECEQSLAALLACRSGLQRPVYISVDKDILRPAEFASNWDQGSISLQTLVRRINELISERTLGLDLCGAPARGRDGVFDPQELAKSGRIDQLLSKKFHEICSRENPSGC